MYVLYLFIMCLGVGVLCVGIVLDSDYVGVCVCDVCIVCVVKCPCIIVCESDGVGCVF